MELIKELTRDEMKHIMAGTSTCRVAYRNDEDDTWIGYGDCKSHSWAESHYDSGDLLFVEGPDGEMHDDAYVSGYCCSSCDTPEFPNATPCVA